MRRLQPDGLAPDGLDGTALDSALGDVRASMARARPVMLSGRAWAFPEHRARPSPAASFSPTGPGHWRPPHAGS